MRRQGGEAPLTPVTLVISGLGVGGAERVMATMADFWAAHGREVTLLTVADAEADHYSLDPRVRRVRVGSARSSTGPLSAMRNNLGRIRSLRRAIASAGAPVVISFIDRTNVLTLIATIGSGTRVIVAVRNDPRHQAIGRAFDLLRRWTYRRAAALVVQTEGLRPWAERLVDPGRCHVIENPLRELHVELEAEPVPAGTAGPTARGAVDGARSARTVVAVGRLTRQKAHATLIRAFATLAGRFPDWDLLILGEGEEREPLARLVTELGLEGRVRMPGTVKDPERHMLASDLFVLSSRFEGFPNVLLEAMALGLPVISTDCESGPADIIDQGRDGLLVPVDDATALAAAMAELMDDPERRAALGERAQAVRERFAVEAVMPKWEALLDA